jgi:hypothetical protein
MAYRSESNRGTSAVAVPHTVGYTDVKMFDHPRDRNCSRASIQEYQWATRLSFPASRCRSGGNRMET